MNLRAMPNAYTSVIDGGGTVHDFAGARYARLRSIAGCAHA